MMRYPISVLASVVLAATSILAQEGAAVSAAATAWPSFRGMQASGVADGFATPVKFDVEHDENIAWKTPIPGLAHSAPVVWGDRIYLTTAVKDGEAELVVGLYGSVASVDPEGEHEFRVLCVERTSGDIVWSRTAWTGEPSFKRHPKGSYAASTPATDGDRIVAFFGTEGLYCYDRQGELQWSVDFGRLDAGWYVQKGAEWGFASSPVIFEGRVYVQCDVQKGSFVAALDLADGKEVWRTDRDEVPTWGTPTVDVADGRRQLIVNGYRHIGGYDLDTGEALWWLEGGGDIPVPTPVVAHGLAFITNAHGRMAPILAVSTAARGELAIDANESEHMIWSSTKFGNYMQTPLVYGDELYCCNDMGILRCYDARTGELHYKKRLEAGVGFSGSGVAADGKVYFTSEIGDVYVVKAGPDYESLAINELGETFMSSPAVSRGVLFFRTRGHLVAVGKSEDG